VASISSLPVLNTVFPILYPEGRRALCQTRDARSLSVRRRYRALFGDGIDFQPALGRTPVVGTELGAQDLSRTGILISQFSLSEDILTLFQLGMCCHIIALVVVLPLLVAGCNKSQKQAEINSTPTCATDSSTVRVLQ
jgi:hypothetical protein